MSDAPSSTPGPGTLVCVVGPSGAGKDTLIEAARRHFGDNARLAFPRRLITRTGQIGEDHRTLVRPGAADCPPQGAFLLSWAAHGEVYAIPLEVLDLLESGRTVVANVSRTVIGEAHAAWPGLAVIHVTAPQAVLAARLAARGREDEAAIVDRLAREAPLAVPQGVPVETIENAGRLADATAAFVSTLERLSS